LPLRPFRLDAPKADKPWDIEIELALTGSETSTGSASFASATTFLWFGLLIQAKRLDSKSHKYPQIKKRIGKRKIPQIDLLTAQARLKGIDPVYFFYNYSNGNPLAFTWNCGAAPLDLLQLGCTVAHAAAVQRALVQGGAGLPKISLISYPLRCLVCCPVLAEPPDSLPGCAHSIAKRLRVFAEQGGAATADYPHPLLEPPDYVLRLLDAAPEQRRGLTEELREQVGPIGSLVIIQDRREGRSLGTHALTSP
jgi:hypothetical protein